MTEPIQIEQLLSRFKLPVQDRNILAFCQGNRPAAVAAWAAELPATRISNTSVLLYKALPEISTLKADALCRLSMLESLRPYVQRCIQGLAHNFLNQPLILPEGAMKTAVIAQALQKHMSNGYLVVMTELIKKQGGKNLSSQESDALSLSLHRAATGLGLQFLRSSQLYTPAGPNLWEELNALYLIAEQKELLGAAHQDTLLKNHASITFEQSYIRTLMLACVKPNQMRQNEVIILYDALESWACKLHLQDSGSSNENLFLIDLSANAGPVYKTRYEGDYGSCVRELDFSPVLYALEKLDSGHIEEGFVELEGPIASVIYGHARESWGVARSRSSKRLASHNRLDVVVGLSAIHFYASDKTEFSDFIMPEHDDEFSSSSRFEVGTTEAESDPWNSVVDAEGGTTVVNLDYSNVLEEQGEEEAVVDRYPMFQTVTLDASSEGYCLDWRDDIPANAKVGELLGIREQGRQVWAVGVVRWVRQSKGASQLGVQMLSPQIKPHAVKQIQKTGDHGDFMRALLIPSFKAAKKPATLITPVMPFKISDKVILNNRGEHRTGQLVKRLFYSSAINQFTYRLLDDGLQSSPEGEDDFSGKW